MKKIWILLAAAVLFSVPFFMKNESFSEKERSSSGEACRIVVNVEGSEIPLEQYVIGVVSAEMPAAYELEALKAQAIAARTYALYQQQGATELKASVLHQVFYDGNQRRERWNADFEQYEAKVTQAVEATAGQVLLYNGKLISAMFHAASNGQTESAKNYSGHDIPYLRSVSSPEQEVSSEALGSSKWTKEQLLQATAKRNESGRVQQVTIAGTSFSGRELRDQLQLRSTDFQFKLKNGELVVETRGYGHGVGMSQQGAQQMALAGANANEIVQHYYSGVEIQQASCKDG